MGNHSDVQSALKSAEELPKQRKKLFSDVESCPEVDDATYMPGV
jgi:hypothetical protein